MVRFKNFRGKSGIAALDQSPADEGTAEGICKFDRIDQLQKFHLYINDMVKFGEAKNGVLLGINVAFLYNVGIRSVSFDAPATTIFTSISLALLLASTIVLLRSFIPRIYKPGAYNPLSFISLNDVDAEEYFHICCSQTSRDVIRHYSEVIRINAMVAKKKLNNFKLAVMLAIPSYLAFAVLSVLKEKV